MTDTPLKKSPLNAIVTQRSVHPPVWAVEAHHPKSPEKFELNIFSGDDAETRAGEYAVAKYTPAKKTEA